MSGLSATSLATAAVVIVPCRAVEEWGAKTGLPRIGRARCTVRRSILLLDGAMLLLVAAGAALICSPQPPGLQKSVIFRAIVGNGCCKHAEECIL